MSKDTKENETNEEVVTEEEARLKAENSIVIGKGSLKSNKGKRLIAKGKSYEVTFND